MKYINVFVNIKQMHFQCGKLNPKQIYIKQQKSEKGLFSPLHNN